MSKIQEELEEVQEAIEEEDKDHIAEEIGDVLPATISLCLHYGFSSQDILAQTNKKFITRYEHMVTHLKEQSPHLHPPYKAWNQEK